MYIRLRMRVAIFVSIFASLCGISLAAAGGGVYGYSKGYTGYGSGGYGSYGGGGYGNGYGGYGYGGYGKGSSGYGYGGKGYGKNSLQIWNRYITYSDPSLAYYVPYPVQLPPRNIVRPVQNGGGNIFGWLIGALFILALLARNRNNTG